MVDGLLCEDIRVGIAVRLAFTGAGSGAPLMYRRKNKAGFTYSFSSGLIDEAGGFQRFLNEWERVEETLVDGILVTRAVPMVSP